MGVCGSRETKEIRKDNIHTNINTLSDDVPRCPECGSNHLYRDGLRYPAIGNPIQKWICRDCLHRYTENHNTNKQTYTRFNRQVCALQGVTKNLTPRTDIKTVPGVETQHGDIKSRLLEYSWYMEKQGYASETIRTNTGCLKSLLTRNAKLLDPESVKQVLAQEENWSQNRRRNVINAYSLFLRINNTQWDKPKCDVVRKIPFIPNEQEIDCLIAGCPTRIATFLQLLKETAMRSGEAVRLHWRDIDFERKILTLNAPEKGSLPRQWNSLSTKLWDMLNALPRKDIRIFGPCTANSIKATFGRSRHKLAVKLQNPRLLEIHFHTLRHWKATMEYHKTKDLLHTMAFLGHKKSDNTLLYVQLDKNLFRECDDTFTTAVAHSTQEACHLIEVGFEYVTGEYTDGGKIFRKRK